MSDNTPAVLQDAPAGTTAKQQYMNDDETRQRFREFLANYAGLTTSADDAVAYHSHPANKISLPVGMTPAEGSALLADVATSLAQEEVFSHIFKYRPWDGAYAVQSVMRKYFGNTGRGMTIFTMFGPIPPEQREIEIGYEQTTQVAWGRIKFSQLEGQMDLGATRDADLGVLFAMTIKCPKRYAGAVQGFFKMVEDELRDFSIYNGKAIIGTDDPKFLNVTVDPTITYNEDVLSALDATVWGVIRNADLLKADGKKVNNRILLEGPYGTGKSEVLRQTAKVATENGWTYIQFQSGRGTLEDLERTIQLARLYSKDGCVVAIEDIDVYASQEGDNAQTRITNMFDGITSKGDKVMFIMTSNKAANFSKGMLRAGRVDRMIHIGALDKAATEQLIRRVVGEQRLGDVDFDTVWQAMDGFEPAFVRQTFDQAAVAALIRTGTRDYVLNTEDFVTAANLLRPQHELHTNKAEKEKRSSIEGLVKEVVLDVLTNQVDQKFVDSDGDPMYDLVTKPIQH